MKLAFAHRRDDDVEGFFRNSIDLFDVQQRSGAQRIDKRTIEEHLGAVAVGEHTSRVEGAYETSRREFGVSFNEDKFNPRGMSKRTQQ
ncbi:unannotated protein [freshwater metagenome]|uniref:Unannotated protein n=1 Tax=freshwater metagenome TaxID=449393 RepID=A0A6J6S2I5_9ZZZZ